MKTSLEMKVGIFILGGLILIIFGIFVTRDFTLFKQYYQLNVEFEFAEGLKKASPVQFSGVAVGEVKSVKVMFAEGGYKVLVNVNIGQDTKIPTDSKFFINSLGVLSEKYLEILPGSESHFLQNGQLVKGISPIPLRNITDNANLVIKKMQVFLEEVNVDDSFRVFMLNMKESSIRLKEILSDESAKQFIVNLKDSTAQLKSLLEDIRNKQGTVGKLIYDPTLYDNLNTLSEDLKNNPWKVLHKTKERKPRK